jgi:myo-inositol 2-dehydrogenase / D-chiro-inositol 1-dehydrogenase
VVDTVTNIALAGFGAWGRMHAQAITDLQGAEVVAVCCQSDETAATAARIIPRARCYRDYGQMLAKGGADVVHVTVPNHLHADFAIRALETEHHVLLEKPLGLTLAECDQVIRAAADSGKTVALNHELRVSHQWGRIREIIETGDIGAVRYQNLSLFRHGFRAGSGSWRNKPEMVGSWVLEELVHFVDLVLWYTSENGKPDRVRACGNGHGDSLIENLSVTLEWSDGSIAVLSQCLTGFEHHTSLEISGKLGAIKTHWSGVTDRTGKPEFDLKVSNASGAVENIYIPQSGEIFELTENINAALKGFRKGVSILSPQDARASVEVCLAIEESYRGGTSISLIDA